MGNITWDYSTNDDSLSTIHFAVDAFNNSYIPGFTSAPGPAGGNGFFILLDALGAPQWHQSWGNTSGADLGNSVVLDANRNAYVVGRVYQPAGYFNSYVAKYGIDTDLDALTDDQENYLYYTNHTDSDTDGDSTLDGVEVGLGLDPMNGTDATLDFDGDLLSNLHEYKNGTDIYNADTDGDNLTDGIEIIVHGTDPLNPDSDNDQFTDGEEVAAGTDPNDPSSYPRQTIPGFRGPIFVGTLFIILIFLEKVRRSDKLYS